MKYLQANIKAIALMGIMIASCESHQPKVDAAFERVKEEKLHSNDSSLINDALVPEPQKPPLVKVKEAPDEWSKFKADMEKKIRANEDLIKALKSRPDTNAKLLKKVAGLEQNNHDLRRQMDAYNEEMKLKWENFKAMVDHDVNEIGIELKNLAIPK